MKRSVHKSPPENVVITNWRDNSHPDAGGAEQVCEKVAQQLAIAGHNVVLLSAKVPHAPRKEFRDGFQIIRRGNRWTVYLWTFVWIAFHRYSIGCIIDSQNGIPFFTPIAARRRTPIVLLIYHVHQEQFRTYLGPVGAAFGRWLEGPLTRVIYGRRPIVTISPSSRQDIRAKLRLRGDVTISPPGWELSLDQRTNRERSPQPELVCVGRLVVHKQTHKVIEAIPALLPSFPALHLSIVGDGPEMPHLLSLAQVLGVTDHVTFHGVVSPIMRDLIVARAWLAVSASANEGWCLAIIEANALGVPALSYANAGLRDSINPAINGWLLDSNDDLALGIARSLRHLTDEAFAQDIAVRARNWAAQFTWEKLGQTVLTILESERSRLSGRSDMRTQTDAATVVDLPIRLTPRLWVPSFRLTDACSVGDRSVRVLLRGADHDGAYAALRRMGLTARALSDPEISISVATHSDLLNVASAAARLP